eukprot:m.18502 g.18502  ORF g.18502 m.18502 type:complete len:487 (-) comp3599_c0_seq1:176-1636(-)
MHVLARHTCTGVTTQAAMVRGAGSKVSLVNMCVTVVALQCITPAVAWTQEALDLYDLVEEVNQNFYEVLGVAEDATSSQIRKAFRTKSLELHPDRSDDPDAANQFRIVAAIADVLKSSESRAMYDDVLVNGLPNWKQPMYYFRATAKLSLQGLVILLLGVSTVMHYAALWARYLERRWQFADAMSQSRRRQSKRADKKRGGGGGGSNNNNNDGDGEPDPAEYGIIMPSIMQLWCVLLVQYLWALPAQRRAAHREAQLQAEHEAAERAAEKVLEKEEAELQAERTATAEKNRSEQKKARRERELREAAKAAEERRLRDAEAKAAAVKAKKAALEQGGAGAGGSLRTGAWSEDERSRLAKAMVRYPGGTINRWELIASELQRSVKDVMKQAHSTKQVFSTPRTSSASTGGVATASAATTGSSSSASEAAATSFTQAQQTQLETALRTVPKDAPDRWAAIAACVDGKSKADCVARVRHLQKMVQQQRQS